MSYQDLLSRIDKQLTRVTSAVTRLEKFLKRLKTQSVEGVKKDAKYYLLLDELVRAEESVRICGLIYQMLFVLIDDGSIETGQWIEGDTNFIIDEPLPIGKLMEGE